MGAITGLRFLSGPFFANPTWKAAAKDLRTTSDPYLHGKRLEKNEASSERVKKFYDFLLDGGVDCKYRGNALGLAQSKEKNALDPANGRISIAVSGGGLRVVAFLAFLDTLREHNIPITNYAGTSAGSIAAMFDRVGFDFKTIWKVLDENLLRSIMLDPNILGILRAPLEGDRIRAFLDASLPENYQRMMHVPNLYITAVLVNALRDPHIENGKWAGDISSYEKVIFSSELDPGMKISDAVFSSMCLPVFESLRFRKREFTAIMSSSKKFMARSCEADQQLKFEKVVSTDKGRTIDGGYMNNYPFDPLVKLSDPSRDVIINLISSYPGQMEIRRETIFGKLVNTPVDIHMRDELEIDRIVHKDANVIYWEIGKEVRDVKLMDFEKIEMMKEAGHKSALEFLKMVGIAK